MQAAPVVEVAAIGAYVTVPLRAAPLLANATVPLFVIPHGGSPLLVVLTVAVSITLAPEVTIVRLLDTLVVVGAAVTVSEVVPDDFA